MTERLSPEWFKSKSKIEGDCWLWQGAKHNQGYGMMRNKGKMETSLRIIGKQKYGVETKKGSEYRYTHTCGNKGCCNPDHIVMTHIDEVMTYIRRVNRPLSDDRVRELRKEYKETPRYHGMVRDLAKKNNLHYKQYFDVIARYSYVDVEDD